MNDRPEMENARAPENRQALFLLGVLSVIGIFLLGLVMIQALSSDTLDFRAIRFTVSSSVAEPVVYAVIFGVCCFLATRVHSRWAAIGGAPFLALALAPFVANGERAQIQEQLDLLLSESAAQKVQIESVGRLVGDLKQSVSNAQIELVRCQYPYNNNWWNSWDAKLDKRCPANMVIVGAQSVHNNGKEDRVRKYLCCSMQVVALP
ncbi:hypothetical protein [Sulfitobacter sp. 20_GPM-1509m]|uniref:hypothetical protein n=1 Tax=Sulfitobacter sp. 20_GPM-1509m TaxID=1380367 RepID=UPI00048D4834|nr:hypothetical protein [Sulfitobacter sp. 20_GPM-1509m]